MSIFTELSNSRSQEMAALLASAQRLQRDREEGRSTLRAVTTTTATLKKQKPGFRSWWSHMTLNSGSELREWRCGRAWSCAYALPAVCDLVQLGSKAETRGGGVMDSAW
jgi:hypothetical protein